MSFLMEAIKFIVYCGLIVAISKYVLATTLRRLAESLQLKSKTAGEIAGVATSVPELLTISVSSFSGLMGASIYNVLSSNVINLIQYLFAIIANKNLKSIKDSTIAINIALSIVTIIIPIILIIGNIKLTLTIVPLFIIFYILFRLLNSFSHDKYLAKDEQSVKNQNEKREVTKIIKYIVCLAIVGILLFVIGSLLGNTLENLCSLFNVPQFVIGVLLGFITSIPELITFFEAQKHHKNGNYDMHGVIEATNNLFTSNSLNLFVIQPVGIIIFTML